MNKRPESNGENPIRSLLESYVLGELSESERRDLDGKLVASPSLREECETVRRIVSAARNEPVPPLSEEYHRRKHLLFQTLFQPRESRLGRVILGAFSTVTYFRVRFRTSPGFRVLVVAAAAQAAVILVLALWGLPRSTPRDRAPDGTGERIARSAPVRLQDGPLEEELPPLPAEDLPVRVRIQPESERERSSRPLDPLLVWGHGTSRNHELFRAAVRKARTDQTQRMALVFRHGGGLQTENAVKRGLDWLARCQHEEGYFSVRGAQPESDTRVGDTALAVLAFLGRGLADETCRRSVERGLGYLIERQQPDGSWNPAKRTGEPPVRSREKVHDALATQALLEGVMMGVGEISEDTLRRSLEHLQAQHPDHPAEVAEAAKVLLLAQSLGYAVDNQVVNQHLAWFQEPENQRRFRGANSPALAFQAGQQLLDSLTKGRPDMTASVAAPPENWLQVEQPTPLDLLGWLHVSHALLRGENPSPWTQWNRTLVRRLTAHQDPDGWFWTKPDAPRAIRSTATSVLLLETYYRYGT